MTCYFRVKKKKKINIHKIQNPETKKEKSLLNLNVSIHPMITWKIRTYRNLSHANVFATIRRRLSLAVHRGIPVPPVAPPLSFETK